MDNLNKQCAEKRENMFLRLPQPSNIGDGAFLQLKWTEDEAKRYFTNQSLPRDLTTAPVDGTVLLLWIFDATGCRGELPELELDPLPDFKKHPALCAFDMDGKEWVALIPSEFLDMVPTGKNKVQFVLNEKGKSVKVS